jgi:hypothetical protein
MTDTPLNRIEINEIELDSSKDTSTPVSDTDKAKKSLAEVEANQESVTTIKTLIDSIIDSIAKSQSMLTRAALFWGKLPLWQKIGAGVLLIAPTLILGIVLQLTILIIISALTLITFVPTSLILDDHYKHDEQVTDKLKDSMTIMATSLESVIETMEDLRAKLADQIENFHRENGRLTNGIIDLSSQINVLASKSKELRETEQELRAIQLDLENTEKTLRLSVQEHTELVQKNQQEIDATTAAFEINQDELSKSILELDTVRTTLGKTIEDNQKVAQIMKETVEKLAKSFILDEQDRNEFQTKLKSFITNKEKTFNEIAQRICKANQELSLVRDELNRTNLRYQSLLDRQANQLDRLDKSATPAVKPKTDDPEVTPARNAHKIKKFGIHARSNKSHQPEHQNAHAPDENSMRQVSVR